MLPNVTLEADPVACPTYSLKLDPMEMVIALALKFSVT